MAGRPRSGAERLTRAGIVAAAIGLADDAQDLAALSMRSVAQRLGVTPMSLYNHVANKDELLDGMVDAVFVEFYAPVPGAEWRSELRRRAVTAREALKRHPWAVGLMDSRRNAGYETLLHHDAVIGCLREAGFSLTMTGHAFAVLDAHLYGFLVQEVSMPFEPGQDLAELGSRSSLRSRRESCRTSASSPSSTPSAPATTSARSSRSGSTSSSTASPSSWQ